MNILDSLLQTKIVKEHFLSSVKRKKLDMNILGEAKAQVIGILKELCFFKRRN